eukprot:427060-Prorocentrum_minimum.AAC.1
MASIRSSDRTSGIVSVVQGHNGAATIQSAYVDEPDTVFEFTTRRAKALERVVTNAPIVPSGLGRLLGKSFDTRLKTEVAPVPPPPSEVDD